MNQPADKKPQLGGLDYASMFAPLALGPIGNQWGMNNAQFAKTGTSIGSMFGPIGSLAGMGIGLVADSIAGPQEEQRQLNRTKALNEAMTIQQEAVSSPYRGEGFNQFDAGRPNMFATGGPMHALLHVIPAKKAPEANGLARSVGVKPLTVPGTGSASADDMLFRILDNVPAHVSSGETIVDEEGFAKMAKAAGGSKADLQAWLYPDTQTGQSMARGGQLGGPGNPPYKEQFGPRADQANKDPLFDPSLALFYTTPGVMNQAMTNPFAGIETFSPTVVGTMPPGQKSVQDGVMAMGGAGLMSPDIRSMVGSKGSAPVRGEQAAPQGAPPAAEGGGKAATPEAEAAAGGETETPVVDQKAGMSTGTNGTIWDEMNRQNAQMTLDQAIPQMVGLAHNLFSYRTASRMPRAFEPSYLDLRTGALASKLNADRALSTATANYNARGTAGSGDEAAINANDQAARRDNAMQVEQVSNMERTANTNIANRAGELNTSRIDAFQSAEAAGENEHRLRKGMAVSDSLGQLAGLHHQMGQNRLAIQSMKMQEDQLGRFFDYMKGAKGTKEWSPLDAIRMLRAE